MAKWRIDNNAFGNTGTKSGSGNGTKFGPDPNIAKSGAAESGTNDNKPFWHRCSSTAFLIVGTDWRDPYASGKPMARWNRRIDATVDSASLQPISTSSTVSFCGANRAPAQWST